MFGMQAEHKARICTQFTRGSPSSVSESIGRLFFIAGRLVMMRALLFTISDPSVAVMAYKRTTSLLIQVREWTMAEGCSA